MLAHRQPPSRKDTNVARWSELTLNHPTDRSLREEAAKKERVRLAKEARRAEREEPAWRRALARTAVLAVIEQGSRWTGALTRSSKLWRPS